MAAQYKLFLSPSRAGGGSDGRAGVGGSSEEATPGLAGGGAQLASTGRGTSAIAKELADNGPGKDFH